MTRLTGAFESGVSFSEGQRETMIREIGEILSVLRQNVIDFEKGETVRLLDGHGSVFRFPRVERLERKRFVSLVNASLPALSYLARNMTATSDVVSSERSDFVIGAIDYRATLLLRQRDPTAKDRVIVDEIRRDFNTPENQILALTLLAILLYSTKAIESELAGRGEGDPGLVVHELEGIRGATREFLRSKRIKEILPMALGSGENLGRLFEKLRERIATGRIPPLYSKAYEIFLRWRNYLWIVFEGDSSLYNGLRHHFDQLNDPNALYECWVYYRVLRGVQSKVGTKFAWIERSDGAAGFRSTDGRVTVTYQKWANTGWVDREREASPASQPWDKPDVVAEVRGRKPVVLDAKNSEYESGYPYREQMQSYLESVDSDLGILVHSHSEHPVWHQIERHEQRMVWTSISPANPGTMNRASDEAYQKLLDNIFA